MTKRRMAAIIVLPKYNNGNHMEGEEERGEEGEAGNVHG